MSQAEKPNYPGPADAVAEIAQFRDGEIAWLFALYTAMGEDRRRDVRRRYVASGSGPAWGNGVRTLEEAPSRWNDASTPPP